MIDKIQKFLDDEFPQNNLVVEHTGGESSIVRKKVKSSDHRPGNTVSGPTMMTLADAAIYVAILGETGNYGAVTIQLTINFLRKPDGYKDLIARCKLLKTGKTLVVGQVELYSEGKEEMVAQATASYTLPGS